MKAIISAATNIFADVVYFIFSPGKKKPALGGLFLDDVSQGMNANSLRIILIIRPS
ncbi:hypothetical protein FHD02_23565 [Citrobacter sp. EC_71]|uniref:hypothetical protein n=1 Tax=Citrobacter sp. EC_71 TaxID=2584093 RepID=UPI001C706D6B|nr:hypothetical protein [Citrobacter sp. EC_71]MBW9354539.1 hypothetical protein [Citrobacter sp. EC_71]